jgi:hypothetical protein
MRNLEFSFNHPLWMALLLAFVGATAHAKSLEYPQNWSAFQSEVRAHSKSNNRHGTALIVSSVLLVASSYLVHVNDPVQVGAVSLLRTVGLLGIGEGAEYVWVSDQRRIFQEAIDRSYGLSEDSKNQILRAYLDLQYEEQRRRDLIKTMTYSLVAAVNIYEGSRQSDETLRTGLYFLGTVGLLRALTLSIDF